MHQTQLKSFLPAALALGVLFTGSPARAVVVDTVIANTSEIRTASNDPFFGAGTTANLAGVNLYFSHQVAPTDSLNGVFFDNVDMGSPPATTLNVTANQPGITLDVSTPGSRDNSPRTGATGADLPVLQTIAAGRNSRHAGLDRFVGAPLVRLAARAGERDPRIARPSAPAVTAIQKASSTARTLALPDAADALSDELLRDNARTPDADA